MTNEDRTNESVLPDAERAVPGGVPAVVDWRHAARCRDEDPDTLFVQGAQQRDAREVCLACPVRTECLAHALDNRIRFGVWGGMTERERRALLRRRPDVVSWAVLLESARRAAIGDAPVAPAGLRRPRAPRRDTPVLPGPTPARATRRPGTDRARTDRHEAG